MPLRLYNTLTRDIETVQPMDGSTLRFYCCGPTVYGPAHIGNFRTFVIQDVFRRDHKQHGKQPDPTLCHEDFCHGWLPIPYLPERQSKASKTVADTLK